MNRYKKIAVITLICGLVVGSLVSNLTYQSNYYFLADLNMGLDSIKYAKNLNMVHYASYLIGKRLVQLVLLAIGIRFLRIEAILGIGGVAGGFTCGMFLTYQLLQQGVQGIRWILCMAMPQWIFYGLCIGFWIRGEEKRGERKTTKEYATLVLLFVVGLLSEIYLNPQLLGMQIS